MEQRRRFVSVRTSAVLARFRTTVTSTARERCESLQERRRFALTAAKRADKFEACSVVGGGETNELNGEVLNLQW